VEQVRIFQGLGLIYPMCLNALPTKDIYTEPGFYNDFSVIIDKTGVIRYKGAGVNVNLITSWIDNLLLKSIDETENNTPEKVFLYQNYPNPFNPITKIKFQIDEQQHVNLKIFDITGKLIRNLIDNEIYAGMHELFWDGKDVNGYEVHTGIYFYTLKSGKKNITKKMTLLRQNFE
jgi:hypothetical protein